KTWLNSNYQVVVAGGDIEGAEKIYFELKSEDISCEIANNSAVKSVNILPCPLSCGFIFHEEKFALVGSGNVYVKRNVLKRRTTKFTFFTAPTAGDYAVHETHGVGRVLGNKKITSTEGTKDYVAVEYAGGDVLYVPVEQLDILSRYLGAGKPSLSKLGGDFSLVKNRVKESIKKMSFDLKNLYEERNASTGFAFKEDVELKNLFDSGFKYEYTPDQVIATEEVFADMKSNKVMDRLICGDVGFGKTEVAFRAIFLAVSNGKQAALLAPTTILTEQHYSTALERFKDLGIKIALLNRFKSTAEVQEILNGLKEKKIDFVIGTHKLLGKNIQFADLGLLVLDEEQRFGVEHKEKIKLLKKNVDTLTLSATPIPRTLHMSLSGIRQISTINTPPDKRLPVQTYVTEETDALIVDAVKREINRGGQAFILYNVVDSIFNYAEKIKRLLPNIKTTVLHGRMDEKVLERGIADFYNGESQLLISTTIIENGIDLPRANTLIVIDADKLGLSTLYQLKGRVGRSDRLAYAYFTFKRDKVLTEGAYERLNAIIEFAEMG
ncbi:MAG: DEAD/DEAH box helicase, partial [Clostridia bacterium]|nr:DEAD/DEAH box helicase [Clostridia bacterium]